MSYGNIETMKAMIEERANAPTIAGRTLLIDGDRSWTYREYRDQCMRVGGFLHSRAQPVLPFRRGHVAVMMENRLEYLALLGGCAYAGLTFFAINPLLRGAALAQTLNKSRASVLVVGAEVAEAVQAVLSQLQHVNTGNLFFVGDDAATSQGQDLLQRLGQEQADPGGLSAVAVSGDDPLIIIYTSGTTGVPKGVLVSQRRLCRSAAIVSSTIPIDGNEVSYLCMPLCHSNALGNFMSILAVGGTVVLRRRFSASGFTDDILNYGITYWSYVGESVHYILNYVHARYGGDEERIRLEITTNPRNKLRFALGNGASAPDQERFSRWFALQHIYEAYGQSEAVIMAFRLSDTPRGSVGQISDAQVKILSEDGSECPPAELNADGVVLNYRESVGQLCRAGTDNTLFLGYFDDPGATARKCPDGIYYSGDLAHIAIHNGKRYLYFDGRTDDWIRKDGENFSAEPIGRLLSEYPAVKRAVAFGVPNIIASDLVMAVLVLRDGVPLDPAGFFAWCRKRKSEGTLGEKWFPDFVRVVAEFDHTATNKIQLHLLKRKHFDPLALPRSEVYWRQRGDNTFRLLSIADYASLRDLYAKQERLHLLDA